MAYIGSVPAANYKIVRKQTITGNGGTTYTLDYSVGNEQEIEVYVNNVRQEPAVAYTVIGTTLTMMGTVASTDTFYVIFQGKAEQTIGIPEKQSDGTYVFTSNTTIGGNATVSGTLAVTGNTTISGNTAITGALSVGGNNISASQAFRNKIINGAMAIDQRNAGTSQTFTAAAALAYSVDRWYGYCTGANVTGQRVSGAGTSQYRYQFTGAASVTAIGFGQRIEAINCYDLNNTTATLSVDLANSLLTSVTWTAYYANTADTFGTLASPTRTQIATGTFTVNSTVTNYSTKIAIPSNATTGIEIVFTVGAQTSGTWTIGNVQLEAGSVATPFERRSYSIELALCQRYYQKWTCTWQGISGGVGYQYSSSTGFSTTMRATPTAGVTAQTNSARYPSSAYAATNIYPYGISAYYAAQSAGGNDLWYVDGTAAIEL